MTRRHFYNLAMILLLAGTLHAGFAPRSRSDASRGVPCSMCGPIGQCRIAPPSEFTPSADQRHLAPSLAAGGEASSAAK